MKESHVICENLPLFFSFASLHFIVLLRTPSLCSIFPPFGRNSRKKKKKKRREFLISERSDSFANAQPCQVPNETRVPNEDSVRSGNETYAQPFFFFFRLVFDVKPERGRRLVRDFNERNERQSA